MDVKCTESVSGLHIKLHFPADLWKNRTNWGSRTPTELQGGAHEEKIQNAF